MNNSYREARGYAFKLSPNNYVDIVHDAFVLWYDKTGQNLFEQHRGVITKTIKNIVYSRWQQKNFMWRGNVYPKKYIQVLSERYEDKLNIKDYSYHVPVSVETPEDIIIGVQMKERFMRSLNTFEANIIDQYVDKGMSKRNITSGANMSRQLFTFYWNKIVIKLNKATEI